jgi:starch synthase (maltosyl-transferring)
MTPPPDLRRIVPVTSSQRVVIRDVAPVTPLGGPVKTVVGDPLEVSAALVRDGHGLLGARLRTRPLGSSRWTVSPMSNDGGRVVGTFVADAPGVVEFEVQAWLDRFSSWRRDLQARAGAGQDLTVEFEVGARLIEQLVDSVRAADRPRLLDAVASLRSTSCTDAVRLAAGLDDAVGALLADVPDPVELSTSERHLVRVDRERAVYGAWYEFFPRSEGGFVAGAPTWSRLEQIAADGFDVVYVPPIHPIGRTHRKGRNNSLVADDGDVGSPWAVGSDDGGFCDVHPELGDLDDVDRFIATVAELGMEVALDIAFQCSPDHPWAAAHPEWFEHLPDGSIRYAENPPKKYQDIYPINFWPERDEDRRALWDACRDVFAFWAGRGVRVFRVDNPHTKPTAFWAWVIPSIQLEWPDVVFLAEAFTDPPTMMTLADVGFSQSYTYFTWRTSKWELEQYGTELAHGPVSSYFRPNFWPTTPDILSGPLRGGSPEVFRVRALLAATMSPSWGIYSGYELVENEPASDQNEEFLNSEKYQLVQRDWEDPASLGPFLADLNSIRRKHRSLHRMRSLAFHATESDQVIAYSHHVTATAGQSADSVLVIANLQADVVVETMVHLDAAALGVDPNTPFGVVDLLTSERWMWNAGPNYVRLDPAERVAHVFAIEHG